MTDPKELLCLKCGQQPIIFDLWPYCSTDCNEEHNAMKAHLSLSEEDEQDEGLPHSIDPPS